VKLPSVAPLEENYLCIGREEFSRVLRRTLEKSGGGAFFKILGKMQGKPYYATILIDNRKILAVEVYDVRNGRISVGSSAITLLSNILNSGSIVVDAFPLDDINVKISIADNIDTYNSTPKMPLSELCPAFDKREKSERPENTDALISKPAEKTNPKPRTEVVIDVPQELEPYFRAFCNRVIKYSKAMGIEVSKIRLNARVIKYALRAGEGIHAKLELEGTGYRSPRKKDVEQSLESFVYKEAGRLSKELGKKVVMSSFSIKI